VVGINYLEKIQLPTLPSLYGAMLAGVSYVLMGAGIPRAIPGGLHDLAHARAVQLSIDVRGATPNQEHLLRFDPQAFCRGEAPTLARPHFLAIVASATVATVLARKASGRVDGLVIEGPLAGGHNAPPRGAMQLNAAGEPIFGVRDVPDLTAIARLGLPFWLAGGYGTLDQVRDARGRGAAGVQVGTAFAFSEESGLEPELKRRALAEIRAGRARVLTDPLASPTGFPFKVFQLDDTLSDPGLFQRREKRCDLGYLRHAYELPDGRVGWRCPGEPAKQYLRHGGKAEELRGRKCVCNGLMANIGLGQRQRNGEPEAPLLTCGTETAVVAELLARHGARYSAEDVLAQLLQGVTAKV